MLARLPPSYSSRLTRRLPSLPCLRLCACADQVPSNLITTSASSAAPPPPGAGTSSSMSQSLAALSVNPSSAAPPAAADDLKSPSSARARSPLRARSRSPLSAGARVPAVVGPQSSTPLSFAAADAAAIAAVVPSPPLPPTTTPTPPPSSTPSPPPAPPAPAPASASSPPKPPPLLSFEQIASFCVPQTPLCNRLCTITSGAYKIQGHPMLHEDKDARKGYERHEFRWNVCWVFDRWAYQGQEYNQVVRKVARVLASCEVRPPPPCPHPRVSLLTPLFRSLARRKTAALSRPPRPAQRSSKSCSS